MKKQLAFAIVLLLFIFMASCSHNQTSEASDMQVMTFERMFEDLSQGKITLEAFFDAINQMRGAGQLIWLYEPLDELLDMLEPATRRIVVERIHRIEDQHLRMIERRRYNLEYIVRNSFRAAASDVDLQTIERFVFSDSTGPGVGTSLVLDRMYGNVYFDPHLGEAFRRLDIHRYIAAFESDDLTRLITVIEASNLREWQEQYIGRIDLEADGGGRGWTIGILFTDGTILRRSGSGMWGDTNMFPPDGQFDIMSDFIGTFGAEIQARHNARIAASE